MPAYNFQGQFVPYIEDQSKPHTVRADRKDGKVPKPGEILYLYMGMRTKKCRKIGEAICKAVRKITITEEDIQLEGSELPWLSSEERELFAWKDGFRPEGTTKDNPYGAFNLMIQFWKHTHELPFQGVVIYWKDFRATNNSI
jgi:hypothetical protein